MRNDPPPLRYLFANPASGCNLNCRHCWVDRGGEDREMMDLEKWIEVFRQASAIGCRSVKFTGGEPLLYPEFTALYLAAGETVGNVSVETNGTLRPEGLRDAFRKVRPELVAVSLDSSDPERHDAFRGMKGCFDRTVAFLEELLSHRINVQVIMSVSDPDRSRLSAMVRFLESIGVRNLKINLITPAGRGRDLSFLDSGGLEGLLSFLEWIWRELPEWVSASVPPAFTPLRRLPERGQCPVRNLMGILPDGTYSLCGIGFSRNELSWGRFPDVPLKDAWEKSPVFETVRKTIPGSIQGICSECIHLRTCRGNCVVNNLETGGAIHAPDALCQRAFEQGLFPVTRMR